MTSFLLRLLRTAAITLVVCYLGVLGLLSYLENQFVYHPTPESKDWQPQPPGVEEIELKSADGNRLGAWWAPKADSKRCVLYFHGNAGNLSHRGNIVVKLRDTLDASVLIVDYPGYGKSTGKPTERGCYQTADAGYAYLINEKKFDPKELIVFGKSLGGAVAVDLATRSPHRAVVLVKTFTSTPDVGARWFPWVPVRLLMRNQFRSIDKIGSLKTPVFIAHGNRDQVIPYEHGQALFKAANEPKEFYHIEGHDHNDRLPDEFFTKMKEFLDRN